MAKRGGGSLLVPGAVQAAYLAFSIVYTALNGLPALGEGQRNPYLAYLALNIVTFPLATLPLPILYTVVVSRRRPTARTARLLREVWESSLVTIPFVALLFKGFVEGWIGRVVTRLDKPLWYLALEGLAFLVLADLWFYLSHRALHTRLLYRFHKAHHAHLAPTEAAAFLALSPAEAGVSGLLTLAFPMLVVPVHAHVVIACSVIILFFGFYIHDGALTQAPAPPLVNGPAQHQVHHGRGRANANYSLIFTFLDRIFGTYAPPAEARLRRS